MESLKNISSIEWKSDIHEASENFSFILQVLCWISRQQQEIQYLKRK